MDEKELQKLKDDLAAAQAALTEKEKELVISQEANSTLVTENTTLKDAIVEKEQAIAGFTTEKLLNTRLSTITEAGISLETDVDKFEKRKSFYLSLSDESFAEYIEELKTVKATATKLDKATASRNTLPAIPRFDARADAETTSSFSDLGSKLRGLSRTPVVTTE